MYEYVGQKLYYSTVPASMTSLKVHHDVIIARVPPKKNPLFHARFKRGYHSPLAIDTNYHITKTRTVSSCLYIYHALQYILRDHN